MNLKYFFKLWKTNADKAKSYREYDYDLDQFFQGSREWGMSNFKLTKPESS